MGEKDFVQCNPSAKPFLQTMITICQSNYKFQGLLVTKQISVHPSLCLAGIKQHCFPSLFVVFP